MRWVLWNMATGELRDLPPFEPALVWPAPSPLTPHQTTYGDTGMSDDQSKHSGATDPECDRIAALQGALSAARHVNEMLRTANTELHSKLDAMAQHMKTEQRRQGYRITDPGVYVAAADPEHGPGIGLHVTKYLLKDAVVLTDPPSPWCQPQWVSFYRDALTGYAIAWQPPAAQQQHIDRAAKAFWVDPSATRFSATDAVPATGGSADLSLGERVARLEAWAWGGTNG